MMRRPARRGPWAMIALFTVACSLDQQGTGNGLLLDGGVAASGGADASGASGAAGAPGTGGNGQWPDAAAGAGGATGGAGGAGGAGGSTGGAGGATGGAGGATGGTGGTGGATGGTGGTGGAAALIQGVEVSLELDHDACGELVIKLTGPDATTLTLASRPGYAESKDDGAGNDRGAGAGLERDSPITFNDSATTSAEDMGVGLDWDESVCKDPPEGQGAGLCEFHPARGAAAGADTFAQAFAGKPPAGVWSLCVGDSYRGQYNGQGNLRGWTLRVRTSPGEALVKSLGVPASEQQIPDAAYKGTTASMRCSSITLP